MEISTKRQLAIILSQLKGFEQPKIRLEQYPTEADFAAEIVWNAFYRREIENKVIADLGCGTGILGFSTLLMGAKKVYFVDIDEDALQIARENMKMLSEKIGEKLDDKCIFLAKDVVDFDEKVDVVVENPPFGIKGRRHIDKIFIEKAFSVSKVIYSFHKAESKQFIDAVAKDNGFEITGYWEFNWPLKQTMRYHKKRIQYVPVGCWRLEKRK
ncbi:methyltransferase [Candidatus Woesearchaeota archaeon]|nr:methyltransferase [Candidatus Woesearchaeota archaeon]